MAPNTTGPASDVPLHARRVRGPLHPKRVARAAKDRPASSTSIVGAALVIMANKYLGAGLSTEEGVTLVAATARIAEWLSERLAR